MKTYQLDIDEELFPELKGILNLFPPNSIKLYSKKGYPIQLDNYNLKLTDELTDAISEGIAELDRGDGISHEHVVHELQAKYPKLAFKK